MKKITKRDIEILQFLYNRMANVHNEHGNFDYMINFDRIINTLKNLDEATQEAESPKTCCAQSSSTTKNKDGLLQCPFCNHDNSRVEESESGLTIYYVTCPFCNTNGPELHNKQDAINAWNKRA